MLNSAKRDAGQVGDVSKHKSRWQVLTQLGPQITRTKREALALAAAALASQRLERATSEYADRQERRAHPDGQTDKGGRWYPSASESQPCCRDVRGPSRSFPWPYMRHCRTMRHLAQLYDVPEAALKKAGRRPPCQVKKEEV